MMGTNWYQQKADECARQAENSVDPSHRARMETESRLWRQIAVLEADRGELPQKALWVAHYE
jgi:hypothetical protein